MRAFKAFVSMCLLFITPVLVYFFTESVVNSIFSLIAMVFVVVFFIMLSAKKIEKPIKIY